MKSRIKTLADLQALPLGSRIVYTQTQDTGIQGHTSSRISFKLATIDVDPLPAGGPQCAHVDINGYPHVTSGDGVFYDPQIYVLK